MQFSHLHVHTQFSLLDGAASIKKLFKKAVDDKMPALAITDHGNMFGVFNFVAEAFKNKNDDGSLKVKPIIGCEFYVVEDRFKKQFTKDNKDVRYHQLLLAKDEEGYHNLSKLCSLGYIDGLYSKWPRIDKELLLKHHKGLIATTCCLGASVPRAIIKKGEEAGEKEFKWWLDIFGEDYYIELQRHGIPEQDKVNEILLKWAIKYNVKVICSNDSHYVDQQDYNAHDILLCVNTGDIQSTPKATDEEGGKGYRFGFPNDQFYFKTTEEMGRLFHDVPQSLDNTNEIVDKIKVLDLKRDILVPNFPIPAGFKDADDYLRHCTFEGAAHRYSELTPEIEERLNFELHTIKTMGFPGYFLIVSDFIKAGRDMGVFIGPGRGSAAGSAVAYCIGITNIDPIKYGMLFERFLNPERKSMPDIDTDFDDEGREKVLNYVIDKYGKNQVAQIINYGTMQAKSAIKDVARALNLPLNEANELTKLFPDRAKSLSNIFSSTEKELKAMDDMNAEDVMAAVKLKDIAGGKDLKAQVLNEALALEGSVRNTGIHASAVIIAPSDLLEHLPLTVNNKEGSEMLVTQWDGKVIEDAGLLKMDFLGLKTLTIIKNTLKLIEENTGKKIVPEEIPLDDPKTFELFKKGETTAVFQFESAGMQKYLKELKPNRFEDLIAMNALYRPGPMEYIPQFIKRKNGEEEIIFELEDCSEILAETYGITVYQEQVMLLSQKLAGFSKGQADTLRKAMGKKQISVLNSMKAEFLKGTSEKGHDVKKCEKMWVDWEAFASYAFNKSHSTCYAFVANQTAFLKANFPSEFMAAVLNNTNDIENTSFFMEECRRMKINVLGPDINESNIYFSVNKNGDVRFGLGMIKGAGEAAVSLLIEERKANGPFKSIFDLTRRVNLKNVNKRVLEALAWSGAVDSLDDDNRARYFHMENGELESPIEKAIRYGGNYQANQAANQQSLFGSGSAVSLPEPKLPICEPWGIIEQLNKEKEVVGMFISGHPLDKYRFEIETFCKNKVSELQDLAPLKGKDFVIGGMVTNIQHRTGKTGSKFGIFTFEDFGGKFEFALFGKDYIEYNKYMLPGLFLFIRGTVQNRFNGENLEAKIKHMSDLTETKENLLKSVQLRINLKSFIHEDFKTLYELLSQKKGKTPIKLNLIDPETNFNVDTFAAKTSVTFDHDLKTELERLGIEVRANT
jgi:DNA polymerase-3 subunit alpha